jgi:hypothetical protein
MASLAECAISLAEFATDTSRKSSFNEDCRARFAAPMVAWPSLGD